MNRGSLYYDGTYDSMCSLYSTSFFALVKEAHGVLCRHFTPGEIQTSRLLSIKTGGCKEDCMYCSQSARYQTGVQVDRLMSVSDVVKEAKCAKSEGATRFCMGAAWREVRDNAHFEQVLEMVRGVKALGLEVCCTLGMLTLSQAQRLKEAGVYAYNHNLDTSEAFYKQVVTTRRYADRLRTLEYARKAGMTLCTGGILGMGEKHEDRIALLHTLASLSPPPESVTINMLVPMKGTPLEHAPPLPTLEVVRVIAAARIAMPCAIVRLSAGRLNLSHAEQFLCFFAGANSIFLGEKLLTSPNPSHQADEKLFDLLELTPKAVRPVRTPAHGEIFSKADNMR